MDPASVGTIPQDISNNFIYNYPEVWYYDTDPDDRRFMDADSPFMDAENGDFRLNPAATATLPSDAGLTLGAGYDPVDLYGTVRGQDGAWDSGAYEYVAPTPPPPRRLRLRR